MAAEQNPSLHIDTDWKKQAQEEKRRLAEEAERAKAPPPGPPGAGAAAMPGAGAAAAPTGAPVDPRGSAAGAATTGRAPASARGAGQQRELPPPSFATLVQTLVTQSLFYLGDLSPRGGEPMVNLDLAKHNIDLLGVLEEKTANNLAPEEKRLLDAALYETRMRYISVASQFIS
jgi:hypothetical protein